MPYTFQNDTEQAVPFRDDAGKHFIQPGEKGIVSGDQHHTAAKAMGLTVTWVQSHRDIILAAMAEDAKADEAVESKPKRKATVTARE